MKAMPVVTARAITEMIRRERSSPRCSWRVISTVETPRSSSSGAEVSSVHQRRAQGRASQVPPITSTRAPRRSPSHTAQGAWENGAGLISQEVTSCQAWLSRSAWAAGSGARG